MSAGEAKRLIGWREWVAFPDLGISRIKAKIDSGARSSSLHAFDLETFERGGVAMVRFRVHPIQRDSKKTVLSEAPLLELRWIRNSSGTVERRPVVRTDVRFMGELWPIELTLTRRDVMGFRMLLGRQAIRGRFWIDPGRSYLGGRPKRKKKEATAATRESPPKGSP